MADRGHAGLERRDPSRWVIAAGYHVSGFVVCPACSIAWECKSPVQPDGGEGLAKHKGIIVRWRLKEVWSKAATRRTETEYEASLVGRAGNELQSPVPSKAKAVDSAGVR